MASLKFLAPNVQNTVRRFPLSIICSFIVFFNAVAGRDFMGSFSAFTILFAIGFFTCGIARLASESRGWSSYKEAAVGVLLAVFAYTVVSVYGVGLPFLLLFLSVFLLIFAAPFHRGNYNDLSFWNFQQQICTGIGLSILSALIFAGGISVALFSIKYLFDFDPPDIVFKSVWFFAVFVYGPFNALSWVPQKFSVEPAECRAAPGLPFILNWILAPLALVYFLILYGYGLKILLEWELPRGNVAYMVTGFGALGILTYVSGWIMRDTGSVLLRYLYKHFFSLLIPPVILLFVAIGVRIDAYGLTQDRYLVLLLAVWMGAMALLYTLRPRTSLVPIFLSLACMLFLASFGPWGAVGLSERSQITRLKDVLIRNEMLADGKAQPAKKPIPFDDQSQISSILEYFSTTHRGQKLQDIVPGIELRKNKDFNVQEVLKGLNVRYISRYDRRREETQPDTSLQRPFNILNFSAANIESWRPVSVRGYDLYIQHFGLRDTERNGILTVNDYKIPASDGYPEMKIVKKENALYLLDDKQKESLLVPADEIMALAAKASNNEGNSSAPALVVQTSAGGYKFKIVVKSAQFRDFGEGDIKLQSINGELFLSK